LKRLQRTLSKSHAIVGSRAELGSLLPRIEVRVREEMLNHIATRRNDSPIGDVPVEWRGDRTVPNAPIECARGAMSRLKASAGQGEDVSPILEWASRGYLQIPLLILGGRWPVLLPDDPGDIRTEDQLLQCKLWFEEVRHCDLWAIIMMSLEHPESLLDE
jgi:hypothetical protein